MSGRLQIPRLLTLNFHPVEKFVRNRQLSSAAKSVLNLVKIKTVRGRWNQSKVSIMRVGNTIISRVCLDIETLNLRLPFLQPAI